MQSFFQRLFGSSSSEASPADAKQESLDFIRLPDHPVSVAFRGGAPSQVDPDAELKKLYELATSGSEQDLVQFFIKSQQIQAGLYPTYTFDKVKTFWQVTQAANQNARVGNFIYLVSIEALKQGKLGDLLQSFPQEQITYAIASLSGLVEHEHTKGQTSGDNALKSLLNSLTKESLEKRPDQDLFELAVEFNKAYQIFSGYDLTEQMSQVLGSVKPNYDQIHFIANLTGNTLVNFQMILVSLAKRMTAKGGTAHLLLYDSAFPGRNLSDSTTQMVETVMQQLNIQLQALARAIQEDPHRLSRASQQLLTQISEDAFLFFCTPRLGHHQRVPSQFQNSLRAEVTDVYRVIDLVEVS